ncbi:MAG: universal stress protein [Rhodopila sp.]
MPQTILALIEQAETAPSVLATAALLQQRLKAGPIQLLHVSHDPHQGFMPTEEVMTAQRWQALTEQAAARTEALKAVVDSWQVSADQAVWHERTGDTETILRTECAMADFIVARRSVTGSARRTLHTLLFDVCRATLIAPRAAPVSLGRHVVVAWKESSSAERVLKFAMPLLMQADQATLLIGREHVEDMTEEPAWFMQALVAGNVPIGVRRFDIGQRAVGEALLLEAQAAGGDLLVMGAYTHSRLREVMLGGATRDILSDASLPVLLAH